MRLFQMIRGHWLSLSLIVGVAGIGFNELRGPCPSVSSAQAKLADTLPLDETIYAEGRLVTYPDAEVTLSAPMMGRIDLLVLEKAEVRTGDLLAELDVSEEQAARAEAIAKVKEAETSGKYYQSELDRTEELLGRGVLPRVEYERAVFRRDQAKAHREALRASTLRLDVVLGKSRIVAPIDGIVSERFVDRGESVAPGVPLLTIADLKRTRIEAEVVESDAGRVQLGATATVRAEGLPNEFTAHVEEIPASVVARRIRPEAPGRLGDVRVLLVKLKLDGSTPMKLGQRVEVRIDARQGLAAAAGPSSR